MKAVFWAKLGRGGLHRPKSDRFCPKNGLGRRGRTSAVGNPPSSADLNDARKRRRSPSADRRRGWARGGLPRTASPRAPPPEARRAEPPQAAKRARQNAAKNPADLHAGRLARRAQARVAAEGNARGGGERAHRERVPPAAAPAARTAAPCAGRAQPRQRRGRGRQRGRPFPSGAHAPRGRRSSGAQRRG